MPEKVAVLTDSVSCLTRELVERYGISIVPLSFYVAGKSYRDWIDITPSEAYKLFQQDPDSFKSTAIAPGEWLNSYRQAAKTSGDILCATLSSKISASYETALEAREMIKDEIPRLSIEVVDTQTCATAQGLVALAAAREAADGKVLTDVARKAREITARVTFLILLDTLKYVYRTGRVPQIASQVGSLLNIKPILTTRDGNLHIVAMARSKKAGIEQVIKIMRDKIGQSPVRVALTHAYAPDDAGILKERISSLFNCVELWTGEFSPLMGYGCGTGALGVSFYKE